MAASLPALSLNTGAKMPSVGLGCWMGEPGQADRTIEMVKLALKNGYRHLDTASGYGNEVAVGKAVRKSGIAREEIFITTKLPNHHHDSVEDSFATSFKNLGVGYIDLYLLHWPQAVNDKGEVLQPEQSPTFVETWLEMEKLLKTGKVKAIGVSNFSVKNLEILLSKTTVVPANNQVELSACLPQFELKEYCDAKKIVLTAYSPFGQPDPTDYVVPFFSDPTLAEIAKMNDANVGQILVSWTVQRGIAVVPKSEKEERMKQNITLIKLSEPDMQSLNNYHKTPGMHRSLPRLHSKELGGSVFGWTYDQLGWPMREGGFVV